jgi:hypothetical protein
LKKWPIDFLPHLQSINPGAALYVAAALNRARHPKSGYYRVDCPVAASSCCSSSFCQLESGLYSFVALARAVQPTSHCPGARRILESRDREAIGEPDAGNCVSKKYK